MARVRGRNARLEEMKIRRSPRLQRTLPPPEKKKHHTDQRAKGGRRAGRSRLNRQASNTPASLAIEIQVSVGTNSNDIKKNDEDVKPHRKRGDTSEDKDMKDSEREETSTEEKVTSTTESKGFVQFQHPKYEGCMWIKGSLVPPYSGVRRWKSLDDAEIEPQLDRYETLISEWATEYAVEMGDGSDENMSDRDKRLIMDTLGKYCAFRGWGGLIDGLSPKEDAPLVSMPSTPHISMPGSPDVKDEKDLDSKIESTSHYSPAGVPDVSTNNVPNIRSDSVSDRQKDTKPDGGRDNSVGVKTENPIDALPMRTLNAPTENPREDPMPVPSAAPPASSPNIPPSISPASPITTSADIPPQNAPKKKPTSPPGLSILLVECLLGKSLYENIIQDPFYYLVKAEDSEIDSVPTTFGRDFYNIWQKLMRASRVKAQRIRMEMTQLLNGFDLWDQCHDISIGAQSRTLRKQATERLVTSLLDSSSAVHPLLRPLDDAKQKETRFKRLLHIFREAAEIAIWMYTQESYFLFTDDIAELGPFDGQITSREECLELGYKETEDTMRPHRFTRRDYPNGVLNGRAPVLMTKPVLRRVFVDSWTSCALNDRAGTVVSRSVVLLGKDEPLDENRTKW